MAISDVTFLIVIGLAAIIFTILVLIWKGLVWMSIISAVFWFLLGFYLVQKTQEGTELFAFQEYVQIVMLGIGFAMIFSPFWLRQKDMDIEKSAPNDVDFFGDRRMSEDDGEFTALAKQNRARIDEMKSSRNRNY